MTPKGGDRCDFVTNLVPKSEVDDWTRKLSGDLTEKAPLGIQNALEAFEAVFDVP